MRYPTSWLFALFAASSGIAVAAVEPPTDTPRPIASLSVDAPPLLVAAFAPGRQANPQVDRLDRPEALPAPRLFVDYELAYSGRAGEPGFVGAVSSHGFRLGGLLFYNELASVADGERHAFIRGNTGVTLDWAAARTRLTLGDVTSSTMSDLGRNLRLAGIGIRRGGDLKPGQVRTPFPAFAGETGAAGTVDVYVDGVHVYNAAVRPGRSVLRNVGRFAGLRQVDVVARDPAGREMRTTRSAYRADRLLPVGGSEFEYAVGVERFDEGEGGYGDLAFVASHRLGLTDRITIGAQVDGIDTDLSASLGVGLRMDGYGVISGELGVAREDDAQPTPAGSLRYSHVYRRLHMTAGYKRAAPASPPATGLDPGVHLPAALVEDFGVKLSYSLDTVGTITLASTRTTYATLAPQVLTTLAYSYGQARRWRLDCMLAYGTGAQVPFGTAEGWTALANLSLQFDEPERAPARPHFTRGGRSHLPARSESNVSGWDGAAMSQLMPGDPVASAAVWETPAGRVYGQVQPGDTVSAVPATWQVGWSGSLVGANGVWAPRQRP